MRMRVHTSADKAVQISVQPLPAVRPARALPVWVALTAPYVSGEALSAAP